jgi:hypothetical protein
MRLPVARALLNQAGGQRQTRFTRAAAARVCLPPARDGEPGFPERRGPGRGPATTAEFHIVSWSPRARRSAARLLAEMRCRDGVVTQHPAAPGQGVLGEGAGPLILASSRRSAGSQLAR